MAGEVERRRAAFKLIQGELKEDAPGPEKDAEPGRHIMWATRSGVATLGACIALTLGAIALKHADVGSKQGMMRFNVMTNIEQLVESSRENSSIRELALQNLESIGGAGREELSLLREAIGKIEKKCRECKKLLVRMKNIERKWEVRINEGEPVSGLRWRRPPMREMPVPGRAPQKLARSRC